MKTPDAILAEIVFPDQTNHYGTLFGGEALEMMDKAAFIAASRLSRTAVVTASPSASATGDTNSTAAAIEFAVETVRVDDIVICGHSQCGAIDALLGRTPVSDSTPHLRDWLKLATPVLEMLKTEYKDLHDENARSTAAALENVLYGLDNLHSYPCVQERLADGSLRLHGWFFKIATAQLFAYDPESRQFAPLVQEK